MEESGSDTFALNQAHCPGIAIGQQRFGIARNDGLEPVRGEAKRFIPRDPFEATFALLPDPAHRMHQTVRVIGALGIARDLGAQHAISGRMIRIALDFDRFAVFNGDAQRACIRAIMRAHRIHDASKVLHGDQTAALSMKSSCYAAVSEVSKLTTAERRGCVWDGDGSPDRRRD
jgi:hypothetical protein